MFETVTVNEALIRGRNIIRRPVVIIQVLIGIAFYYFVIRHHVPVLWGMLALPAIFILPWLYWSFAITRWRLWAFENVRNVHELKRRAIRAKLIWPDGNFLEKTEFRTANDNERLRLIAPKFELEDIVSIDYSTANETRIYISRSTIIIILLLIAGFMGFGIYFLVRMDWTCLAFFGAGIAVAVFNRKTFTDKSPRIVINDQGIKTAGAEFYTWDEIGNEDVVIVGEGKQAQIVLAYDCPSGREEYPIGDLDVNSDQLVQLLVTYRQRSGKKYKFEQNNFLTNPGRRLTKTS